MYIRKFLRILSLCMIPAMLLGACGATPPAPETQPTEDIMKYAYHKEDPAADDTLYILTLGSSNSYYFLDELYGLLDAAGIKAKVCTLMRSSTSVLDYHKFWKNNESIFQFIIHDEKGVTTLENMNLDLALKYYNFDVYSMQEWGAPHRQGKAPQVIADERALAHKEIFDHVREKCPLTKLYYNEHVALDIGYDNGTYQMTTVEQRDAYQKSIRDYTEIVCKDFDLHMTPSGRAWSIARQDPLGNCLTARLAVNNGEGDYAHDGDIGGGQYLNACTWFENITGRSCVGNTFRPVYTHAGQEYTLSEEMIALLQNAAHQAVEELKNGK